MLTQSSIPEVKEEQIGFAINERKTKLSQFLDLGPPDLITLVKYIASTSGSTPAKISEKLGDSASIANVDPATILTELHSHDKLKGEIGTYFYSLGTDTSDPTSITIFLKKIADLITEEPQVWFGKRKPFQVARVSMSTWNTFRKCDMNIIVHMPGTVQMFILDANDDQINIEPSSEESKIIWAETFVSGVVRSMMLMKDNYEDGEVQNLVETLIVNPLTSGELDAVADTFIDLFPMVYEKGELLGSPCDVINTSRTNNYLAETLIEIVKLTHSVDQCREMLEKLMKTYPEVVILLTRVLFASDMEVDAIELICDQLEKIEESESMGSNEDSDPSVPLQLDYKSELLCVQAEFLINVKHDYVLAQHVAQSAVSCTPSEFRPWFLLTRAYIRLNDVENALYTLNACPMAISKEKYSLKRVVPFPTKMSLHLPLPVDVVLDGVTSLNPQDIQREHKTADLALVNLASTNLKSTYLLCYKLLTEIVAITGWDDLLKFRAQIFIMENDYQRVASEETAYSSTNANTAASLNNIPVDTNEGSLSPESESAGNSNQPNNESTNTQNGNSNHMDSSHTITSSASSIIRSKRLCERWLDNLIMLLYEDFKVYTLWQTEHMQHEAQNTDYRKLTFEWELFGLCARRLGHYPEAAKAFQTALSQRFSAQSARKLLEYCVKERQRTRQMANVPNSNMTSNQIMARINELDMTIIDLCVKVCCWNHRWYIEFSTQLLMAIGLVVQDIGLTKVSNEISARYPKSVFELVKDNILIFLDEYANDYFDS
ncbi:similar to Saccharomyces cerevisiae YOR299W BUD7 Member of the ChAPs family of proteins [Maudiozyma saulgeensis]|uniref:Similar to Saccharomyces cerevisiae YOR299W BUD7 Member of the ChAPs family of proteins n=1 Tax=Maudiozyma saulgeensis TaxID=1789683 RepID=A0A1X7R516_9SACH|nr:similar to Saccharomyces cerevisiae YOR299W BUD7 Member of the ChAPs family of proteins [Kazachstania saulgeensis]